MKFFVAAVLLLLAACNDDYAEEYQSAPMDAALWAAVQESWVANGFPEPGEACTTPTEVVGDAELMAEMCDPDSLGCELHGQVFILDGRPELETRKTRAHEMAHWLVECTCAASQQENLDHSIPGIWRPTTAFANYVIKPWAQVQ